MAKRDDRIMGECCPHDLISVISDDEGQCDRCDHLLVLECYVYADGQKFWNTTTAPEMRTKFHPANMPYAWKQIGPTKYQQIADEY